MHFHDVYFCLVSIKHTFCFALILVHLCAEAQWCFCVELSGQFKVSAFEKYVPQSLNTSDYYKTFTYFLDQQRWILFFFYLIHFSVFNFLSKCEFYQFCSSVNETLVGRDTNTIWSTIELPLLVLNTFVSHISKLQHLFSLKVFFSSDGFTYLNKTAFDQKPIGFKYFKLIGASTIHI